VNRWPGGGEGWLTAKGYSWLTGRPAVDNGVTDGQSPLLTAVSRTWHSLPVTFSCQAVSGSTVETSGHLAGPHGEGEGRW